MTENILASIMQLIITVRDSITLKLLNWIAICSEKASR